MARKVIKDLRIGDTIYKHRLESDPELFTISDLSKEKIRWGDTDYFTLEQGDDTRWTFESTRWEYTFFLNKLDALEAQRKSLDAKMKAIFEKQQDFYQKIKETNSAIRECDEKIALELNGGPKF